MTMKTEESTEPLTREDITDLERTIGELSADMPAGCEAELLDLKTTYEELKKTLAGNDVIWEKAAEAKAKLDVRRTRIESKIEEAKATSNKHAAYRTTQAERAKQPRLSKVALNWQQKVLTSAERRLKTDPAIGLNALADSLFIDHGDSRKRGRSRATIRALVTSVWHTHRH
jgi:hypothetical protein